MAGAGKARPGLGLGFIASRGTGTFPIRLAPGIAGRRRQVRDPRPAGTGIGEKLAIDAEIVPVHRLGGLSFFPYRLGGRLTMEGFGVGAQLIWESGDRQPFPLNKVITTLGRNESNDIFLDDPKVSSFHGNILNREDGFHLLDLKSRNGTLVNGKPVTACALRDGDALAFGDIRLRFKALTPFPKGPLPLARLNRKIHTIAIQSPGMRREVEEILREVERHQDFLKALVETVSGLAESRTL